MKKILAASFAAMLLSACSTTPPALIDAGSLEGQTLRWTYGETATGQTPMLVLGKEGRLSGFSGCNRIMGSWRAEGTSLTFTQVAATRMMCDRASMKTEERFLKRLSETAGAVATEKGVDLVDKDGKILLNLEKVQ